MNILHYILGYPPHRTGGLTKYALDLIEAEKNLGYNVFVLYPCNFSLFSNKSKFKKEREGVYQLTNGMPIPLMYGTKETCFFIKKREIVGFQEFWEELRPDVFHVHTLMGLPKELLAMMKEAGVRIVYTSHDYYGLCPRVNFITSNNSICEGANAKSCTECCKLSPGITFLKVRNSKYVVPLKKVFSKYG